MTFQITEMGVDIQGILTGGETNCHRDKGSGSQLAQQQEPRFLPPGGHRQAWRNATNAQASSF